MKRSDITDRQVVEAYIESGKRMIWPYEILSEWTGAPEKVAYRACERAFDRGYIEYGTSLRSGWVTKEGMALLADEMFHVEQGGK